MPIWKSSVRSKAHVTKFTSMRKYSHDTEPVTAEVLQGTFTEMHGKLQYNLRFKNTAYIVIDTCLQKPTRSAIRKYQNFRCQSSTIVHRVSNLHGACIKPLKSFWSPKFDSAERETTFLFWTFSQCHTGYTTHVLTEHYILCQTRIATK